MTSSYFLLRRLTLLLVVLSTAFGLSAQAQAPAPNPSGTVQPPSPPPVSAPVLVTMFNGDLTTKNASEGQTVSAKVVKELKVGSLTIPKGATLTGTVSFAQSAKAGNGTSSLGIEFEKIEISGNQAMPVRGLIVAIGQLGIAHGVGFDSVLGRGGVGSTQGLDPGLSAGQQARDDIPAGSSLEGVSLATRLDAKDASQMRGVHRDIELNKQVMMKVALFRAK